MAATGQAARLAPSSAAVTRPDPQVGRPLVGRDQALGALLGIVTAPPGFVLVEGETGVGKTALIEAALRDPALARAIPLVGHCRPLHEPLPLGPVVEALTGLAGRLAPVGLSPVTGALRPLLPELAEVLPPPPDHLPEGRAEQQRLFRALTALLEAAAPVVLVLEDLHWMDRLTEEFVGFLAGAVPAGVALVVSYRPEELEQPGPFPQGRPGVATARIGLQPLDPAEVGELAGALLGADQVSEEFAAFLHERTAGLPFAVEEVLQLLQERQEVVRREGRWLRRSLDEMDVPEGVRDTVIARLRQLPDGAQRAAEALAVLADPSSTAVVAQTAGLSEQSTVAGLDALDRARLLHQPKPGLWELRHALAAQSVADAVTAPTRSWLHRSAARCLEQHDPPPYAALARHYREAGEVADWARCAEAAADLAAAAGNPAAVADLLHDLVRTAEVDVTTRGRLALRYGSAAVDTRDHQRSAAALGALLEEPALDTATRGRLRFRMASALVQCGQAGDARAQAAAAIEELRDQPGVELELLMCLVFLGFPWLGDDHLDEHLTWLDRAAEFARRTGWEESRLAGVRSDRALVLVSSGDRAGWRDAERLLAADATPGSERLRLAYNLAYAAVAGGHLQRARGLLDIARNLAEELQHRRFGPPIAGVALWLDWAGGDWQGLGTRARELEEAGADSPTALWVARLVQAALRTAAGDVEAGLDELDDVADRALAAGEPGQHLHACAEIARVAPAAGAPDRALAAARRGLDLVRTKGLWPWAGELAPWAVAALLAGEGPDEAAALVEELDERLRGLDAPAGHAGVTHARAVLAAGSGDEAAAADGYEQARRAWDTIGRSHPAALAAAERGRLLATADRDEAVAVLRAAAEQLDALGAGWDAARVLQWLRQLGVRPTHRRGRKGYGSALSPREREVAELAVAGLSNPEISERLVLSPRTVERHMSSVLRKLGVRSRAEVVLPEPETGGE